MKTKLAVALTIICMKASAQWVEWPVSAGGNGHFYLPVMTTTNISWQDAQRLASGSDAYLATVTSDAENTFVFGLVNSPQWVDTSRGPLLGGYQLEGAQEPAGGWAWVTGEPWVFGSWWPTMPDNGAAGREDALHYLPEALWNDRDSTERHFNSYILERGGTFQTEWPVSAGGNGHSYMPVRVSSHLSWSMAAVDARRRGGYLATLTTRAENDFVFNLVNTPQFFGEFGPMLGGYQPPGASEPLGGWTWITGEPWDFQNWASGQPDNATIPEDGLHFWAGNQWNDIPTNLPNYFSFVVEFETPPLCTPRKAKANVELVNGFVVGATITDGGCGYTNPPVVLIQGGGGSGAMATAVISNGQVVAIQILNAGFSYETPPRVVIGSPPFVPTVSIAVSKVNVTQNVVLGWKYVLESSTNAVDWSATGEPFVADSESVVKEFDADTPARMFRLRVVP